MMIVAVIISSSSVKWYWCENKSNVICIAEHWVHLHQNASLEQFKHDWINTTCYPLTSCPIRMEGFYSQCLIRPFSKESIVLMLNTSFGKAFQVGVIFIGCQCWQTDAHTCFTISFLNWSFLSLWYLNTIINGPRNQGRCVTGSWVVGCSCRFWLLESICSTSPPFFNLLMSRFATSWSND